jgi:uncharacterized flavoprotein (TIGR03862 family)
VGRKFLFAGKSGMNITHAEPLSDFLGRYGARREELTPIIEAFSPQALRNWVHGLGVDTFVGSSGRVFPTDMKAAPLLRAWLPRLREAGVRLHMRHRWLGWADVSTGGSGAPFQQLRFATPDGERVIPARATVLALGGGSWSKLGSDGAWVPRLAAVGVEVAPLLPANCGFEVCTLSGKGWSPLFRERFAGEPIKAVVATVPLADAEPWRKQGEFVVTERGVEGSLIYALSAPLRDTIASQGEATLLLDLLPGYSPERVLAEVSRSRGTKSLTTHLSSRLNLKGVKAGLLREVLLPHELNDPPRLAATLKALPLRLCAASPLEEAISTAGGVRFESLDQHLMLRNLPGVFCAGEMLDWEAPTGGYLLTACFASGRTAGCGVLDWLSRQDHR